MKYRERNENESINANENGGIGWRHGEAEAAKGGKAANGANWRGQSMAAKAARNNGGIGENGIIIAKIVKYQ
jgi:hypothetical protein